MFTKSSHYVSIIAVLLTVAQSAPKPEGRILGGHVVEIEQFPWQVLIDTGTNYFGGVLVSENALITVAEGLQNINIEDITVTAGVKTLADVGSVRKLQKIVIHPQFNSSTHDADIAVLFLTERLEFSKKIQPATLALFNENVYLGYALISGWGLREAQANWTPNQLSATNVSLLNSIECQEQLQNYQITEKMVCAMGFYGQGFCNGDTGSGLWTYNENKVVGLASWHTKCEDNDHPEVYVRISSVRPWIDEVLENF